MIFAELSDPVLTAIIAGIVSIVLSFMATVATLITIWFKMKSLGENVQKIETATNSMKDDLVALTDKEAKARGFKEGTEAEAKKNKIAGAETATVQQNIEQIKDNTGKMADAVVENTAAVVDAAEREKPKG